MVLYNPLATMKVVMLTLVDPDEKDEVNPFYLPERPTETVLRRLAELHLTVEDMHHGLYRQSPGVDRMNVVLAEEDYPTYEELFLMLSYVGMELVAVKDTYSDRMGENGHWYSGGRCQYCGINDLDALMYTAEDELCPQRPNQTDAADTGAEEAPATDLSEVPMADDLNSFPISPRDYQENVDEENIALDSPPRLRAKRE